MKHPCHTSGGTEFSVENLKYFSYFWRRAVFIIGENLTQHSNAAGCIAFVKRFFQVATLEFTAPSSNCTRNIFLRHTHCLCRIDCVPHTQVRIWIWSTELGSHNDCLGQLAPKFSTFGIDQRLFSGDVRPMRMACHA